MSGESFIVLMKYKTVYVLQVFTLTISQFVTTTNTATTTMHVVRASIYKCHKDTDKWKQYLVL